MTAPREHALCPRYPTAKAAQTACHIVPALARCGTWGGMRTFTFALSALALFSAPTAFADAIGIPERCPEHSTPYGCHGPETCAPETCGSDQDCETNEACRAVSLCTRPHCCRGGWSGGCTMDSDYNLHVVGPCGAGGSCEEEGSTCGEHRVCVPRGAVDAGGTDAGRTDAGRSDAGRTDAGRGNDAGRREDAGREEDVDAGQPGSTDGGCCSVAGARDSIGGALFAMLAIGLLVRRMRK
jgi:hypothetical protein